MRILFVATAACLTMALQGAFAGAQAINANGHCTGMTVTDFVSSDVEDRTSLTTWQNVTDGRLNITTSSAGCVMIMFEAAGFAYTTSSLDFNYLEVRTLLDGNNLCVPALTNDTFLSSLSGGPTSTNTAIRICKNVPAGVHSVQVQFRREGNGTYPVYLYGHVLTITHR